MKRKKERTMRLRCLSLSLAMSAGLMQGVPLHVKAADYEAKIGGAYYEELEEAFANVKTGEVITVLKDCQVSKTLEITAEDVTLKSEDGGNPATIRREEEFTGKSYGKDAGNVLLGISSGSLTTQDIILEGGAVLDVSFNNSGETWDSPLVYVKGTYTMEDGTVLKNNYNTDGSEAGSDGGRTARTSGALHVENDGRLTMNGGLIQDCYTLGGGGGIQAVSGSDITITSGTVRHCSGIWGGALGLYGAAEVSGMTLSDNSASSTGGAVWSISSLTLSDCEVKDNKSDYDAGGIYVSASYPVEITGCTITGNSAGRGSAIQSSGTSGTHPLTLQDCTITGNLTKGFTINGGAISYMQKAGIILDGNIVMADNLSTGTQPSDISFWYNDAAPIELGEDFNSASVFVLGGMDILPEKLLVDATTNGIETDAQQFIWNTPKYRTIEKDGDIYLGEIPETYSITYDANNNEDAESITYADPGSYSSEDTVVILDKAGISTYIDNFSKEGYDFTGWNTQKDGLGTDYSESQEVNLTEDLYLYAKWEAEDDNEDQGNEKEPEETQEFVVTFDADGGSTARESITAKKGENIILPVCYKTGYEFIGWFIVPGEEICAGQAGEEFTVLENTTLKAFYEKKAEVTYTITFDADGGKEVKPIKAAKGEIIRLPKTEKEGYLFLGWYTQKSGGILLGIPGGEMTVTKDMTAYALWEKKTEEDNTDPETCRVIFHAGKGTIETTELTIIKNGSLYLPLPERIGYEFTGWYLDEELTQFAGAYRDAYRIIRDTDFYAKWEKVKEGSTGNGSGAESGDNAGENLNTYTVKYDANGGATKNNSVKVVKGGSIKLPTAEHEGYVFKGWYTDRQVFIGTEGEVYKPTRSITLYARWEKVNEENENDSDNNSSNIKNTDDNNNKGTTDKNTIGTVSGNTVGSPSDKDTDTEMKGGNGNAGKETASVIQTGHSSPYYLFAALGMCGVLLAAFSLHEGKKKQKGCLQ